MAKSRKWRKGIYQIINNDKYIGKRPVVFRSDWERRFCYFCDNNPGIIEWSSESVIIMYFHPIKKKMTRYYPDFLIKYRDSNGDIKIDLIEIKPFRQTIPPRAKRGKKHKTLLQESKTYAVNKAKWDAALNYCNQRGITFRIITEKDLKY